ncbi:serine/threonine-protein phosphatase 6 regulatory ankyrin repeat subunit B-like [Microplitis mediator]|uniref:serine/threonine-protein phosphatase 6 regulatory ankyrin repeat subunit B-like n=1 Tax=Microplitis mediator TaxID=375433 RepID=UPI002553C5C8|nr:serine/threonine-protein phosphatase 6 regulatory ankyrin repeat subunit B-like [Microplitis mediator]
MSSVTNSDITSSNQVRDEGENSEVMEISNESEVSVISSKNRVSRPAVENELRKIAKSLRKYGVELIDRNNYLVGGSLEYAARVGDIKLVELRIRQGADVNDLRRNGRTPLHVAAQYGHPKIIELLVNNGARLDSVLKGPTKTGYTPLHLACLNNKIECVNVLLKYGASVTPKCADVYHPIHFAVYKNFVEVAALLLENGADVNLRFNNKFFRNKWDENILWKDMDLTLLHFSIAIENDGMTALLLEYGADIHLNTRTNKTSLMHAVEANDPELVKSFLARGANPNDRDIYGEPVLFYIVVNANIQSSYYDNEEFLSLDKKLEIIELLYAAGADVNVKFLSNKSFDSLVHYTCMYGYRSILEFILYKTNFDWRKIDCAAIEVTKLIEEAIPPWNQQDLVYITQLKDSFDDSKCLLLYYIISRHMIGFPVKEELLSAIYSSSLHGGSLEEYAQKIEFYKNDIGNQIRNLKLMTIGNTKFSLWHVLTCKMADLVSLSFQEDFRSLCVSDYITKYSIYYNIIEDRWKAAIKRGILIKKSREIVFDLFHTHLQYDCCEAIVTSFNNQELEDFLNLCSNEIIC